MTETANKKRWYVLQAFSGFEARVATTLREYIKLHNMEDQFGYVEPQYLYAQANSLAKVVMGTTVCSAEVGNIKYKNPVGAGTNLVAKAEIVRRRGNKFFIWVIIRDKRD